MVLASNLRSLVAHRGVSLRRLAKDAEISERTLHNILGEKVVPGLDTLVLLADKLQVRVGDLLLLPDELLERLGQTRD